MITSQVLGSPAAAPVMEDDDLTLVRHAQRDLRAFSALYERYATRVYRYLLFRVGNADDAQDLTSQTFLAAMENLPKYRGQSQFIAWLLGIARHKTADQFRRRKPETAIEDVEMLADNHEHPDELIGRQLEVEQVTRKLQILAPDRAEALSLRLFAELEVREIAQIMDRDEAAVRMLVWRGLKDLQAQLTREERR
ncbi:MAG: sigma-70 family RNA polymerase sigma factor [Ardenticatenaceae bacterium]|nr:sigma-70 family RNA polymerase sigma factor [Ardenticatenaceae bacterium]